MTSFTLVRRIKASPAIVFDAVTTAEGIAHWWGPDEGPVLLSESEPRVGGRYRLRFRKLDDTEKLVFYVVMTVLVGAFAVAIVANAPIDDEDTRLLLSPLFS